MVDLVNSITILILAGGYSTRLKDFCTTIPKPMLPFNGSPFLSYPVAHFVRAGFPHIKIVAGYLGQTIDSFFSQDPWNQHGIQIALYDQPQGTGRDFLKVLPSINTPHTLLLNGDTIVDFPIFEAIQEHLHCNSNCTVILTRLPNVPNEGAFLVGKHKKILSSLEANNENESIALDYSENQIAWRGSSTGTILFKNEFLKKFTFHDGHLSLEKELLPKLIQSGKVVAFDNHERCFHDFGTPERLKELINKPDILNQVYGKPYINKQ